MAFLFFLLYLILAYVRPFELFPQLFGSRIMLVTGALGITAAVGSLPFTSFPSRAKQLPLVALFALWLAFSRVLALRWFGGAAQALAEFAITLFIFIMGVLSLNSERRLRITFLAFSSLALILVLLEILAMHYGVFRDLLVIREGQINGMFVDRARGTGFIKDPNDLAQTLVVAIPFLALAWRKGRMLPNLFLVAIPATSLLYGIYLTRSRGAFVTLVIILFVALRPKGAFVSVLGGLAGTIGVLAMAVAGRGLGMDHSASNRLEAWSAGLQLLKSHPVGGVGYGMFTDFNEITAHNSFVLCFAELGLPGYFLWLALLVVTVMELNAIRKLPETNPADVTLRRYARAVQIALYGFLVSAWFLSRTYTPTLYLIVALAIGIVEMARRAGKPVSFPLYRIGGRAAILVPVSICLVYLQIKLQVR